MKTSDRQTSSRIGKEQLQRLLRASRIVEEVERRGDERFPFFAPVILRPAGDMGRQFSAFAREVSRGGIGLLHAFKVDIGDCFEILIRLQTEGMKKTAAVQWCTSVGEGWYLSGWHFVHFE